MQSNDTFLYISRPTGKSLGGEYRIYPDRIELKCPFVFLTQTLVIRKEDLIAIEVFEPSALRISRASFWALKLDLADLNEHVGIRRKTGLFKQLRFTPENPREFVAKVRAIFQL